METKFPGLIPIPKEILRGALLAAGIFFVGYFSLISTSLLHADAAEYIDDMRDSGGISNPVHIGYILFGQIYLLAAQAQQHPDFSMNLLNLFWGSFTLFFLYLTAYHLTGKQSVSLIACLILAVNYTFVFNSIFAEIYIMQVGCLMAGLYFHLRERYFFSGIFLSISVLTSPLSLLALPLFYILNFHWKPLLIISSLVFIPLLLVNIVFPDYANSGRFTMAFNQPFIFQRQGMIEFNEITNGYFVFIPALVVGCYILFTSRNLRRLNLGIGAMFLANFFLGERFYDVPGQLFTLCLLSIASAAGLAVLLGSADATLNKKTFLRWVIFIAAASFISALMTGFSVKVQRGMDAIPIFYLKTGIIVAAAWILFAVFSKTAGMRSSFLKQFTALGLVGMLLFFNLKFTLVRTMEDQNLAEKKMQNLIEAKKNCINCWVVGNWNDVVLFHHYCEEEASFAIEKNRTLCSDWLNGKDEKQKVEVKQKLNELTSNKIPLNIYSELPDLEKLLKENGYLKKEGLGFATWYHPQNPPVDAKVVASSN